MLSDMSLEPPPLIHAGAKLARCCPENESNLCAGSGSARLLAKPRR